MAKRLVLGNMNRGKLVGSVNRQGSPITSFVRNEMGMRKPFVKSGGQSLYVSDMKLAEIEQNALALPERERARLAARLLETLPPPGMDVSDKEIDQRERELESGQVEAISHEECVRRVQQDRGG